MSGNKQKSTLTSWFVTKPFVSGVLIFLLMQAMVTYIVYQRSEIIKENDRREMANVLHVVYDNLNQTLKNSSTAALTLALTINDEGQPENFDLVGRQILTANPAIDAVQLVPDGVIKYICPLKGNEAALDLNILESAENKDDALAAIKNKKMYFAGPLKLQQGGVAIIGRLPVYQKGKFWGFSGIVIRMEDLIKVSGLQSIDDAKYYFQFSHINVLTKKEEYFLPVKENFEGKYYDQVVFPDSDWKLYIITKDSDAILYQLLPMFILGTLFSLIFGFVVVVMLRKPAQLQLEVLKQTRKLLNSEIKYKTIFDQAAVGIAHIDSVTGNFIELNKQYCKMLDTTGEDMKGINVHAITHPDDIDAGKDLIENLRCGKIDSFSIEKRYLSRADRTVWANVTVSPLWKRGEKPTTQIAIAEDITSKKEAEEQVRQTEARFKSLFEDSPVALWEEDFSEVKKYLTTFSPELHGGNAEKWLQQHPEVIKKCIALVRIIDINNECLKLHRPKTRAELLSANLAGVLDDESHDSFLKQLIAIVKGVKLVSMETRIYSAEYGNRDIQLQWNVMRGYEETLERVIISTEDITSHKEYERIIMQSQQKIESLINSIDGIVWECDFNTYEFTFVNKKAEEISGYPVSEWLDDPQFWADKIHPDDRTWAIEFCQLSSQTKSQYDFEYRMIARDGSIIWMRDIVNVIRENGVPVSLKGIMIDITKTKEAEKIMNDSLELVNEQKKRLMNFSYIVSHNLRSHAANIQSITTLVETADSDDERDELIQMLKTVSGSLNETMMNLNDLVNVQTNVTLAVESLSLKQYIENAQTAISDQIESKGATIISNVSDDVTIDYNPAYFESILLNLLSNALRYSHPERKPIITLDWVKEGGKHVLKVTDNGIGIDMERHGNKLFGMHKTFNGNSDARGIGLFMTRSQIEAMRGSISAESELGSGTAFTVHFK
jgi:PAS domain S-box-containing protein